MLFYKNILYKNIEAEKGSKIKGELNPKIDFSSFEHLGIVEHLYKLFLSC